MPPSKTNQFQTRDNTNCNISLIFYIFIDSAKAICNYVIVTHDDFVETQSVRRNPKLRLDKPTHQVVLEDRHAMKPLMLKLGKIKSDRYVLRRIWA